MIFHHLSAEITSKCHHTKFIKCCRYSMGLGAEASHQLDHIFSSGLFYSMFDEITQISLSPHSHHACFSMSSTLDTYISVSVQPMFAFCTWLASLSATSSDSIHTVVWTGFPSCEALATLPLSVYLRMVICVDYCEAWLCGHRCTDFFLLFCVHM